MVGSAIAISLLTYNVVPLWAGVLITAVASFLLLLLEQAGVRFLEAVFAVLIGTMAVSFGVMYVLAGVPTAKVVEGGFASLHRPRCCCMRVPVTCPLRLSPWQPSVDCTGLSGPAIRRAMVEVV